MKQGPIADTYCKSFPQDNEATPTECKYIHTQMPLLTEMRSRVRLRCLSFGCPNPSVLILEHSFKWHIFERRSQACTRPIRPLLAGMCISISNT